MLITQNVIITDAFHKSFSAPWRIRMIGRAQRSSCGVEVSHNGRRMSKKRTVNGQRSSGGRKGLVSRTFSPVCRRIGTPTKVEKVSGRFPSPRSVPRSLPPPPFFPSGSYVALFRGISLFRTESRCATSLAQPNCNGICLRVEKRKQRSKEKKSGNVGRVDTVETEREK